MAQDSFVLKMGPESLSREDLVYVCYLAEALTDEERQSQDVFFHLNRLSQTAAKEVVDRYSGRERRKSSGSAFDWIFSLDLSRIKENETLQFFVELRKRIDVGDLPVSIVSAGKAVELLPSDHLVGVFGHLGRMAGEELRYRRRVASGQLPTITVGKGPEDDRAPKWRQRRQDARVATSINGDEPLVEESDVE